MVDVQTFGDAFYLNKRKFFEFGSISGYKYAGVSATTITNGIQSSSKHLWISIPFFSRIHWYNRMLRSTLALILLAALVSQVSSFLSQLIEYNVICLIFYYISGFCCPTKWWQGCHCWSYRRYGTFRRNSRWRARATFRWRSWRFWRSCRSWIWWTRRYDDECL